MSQYRRTAVVVHEHVRTELEPLRRRARDAGDRVLERRVRRLEAVYLREAERYESGELDGEGAEP